MDKFLENSPVIIKAAAENPLGPIALIIIILALLGVLLFSRESLAVRIVFFGFMFAFGIALVVLAGYTSKPDLIPTPTPTPTPTIDNTNKSSPKPEPEPPKPSPSPSPFTEPKPEPIGNVLIEWGEFDDYFKISDLSIGERPETNSNPPLDVLNFTVTAKGNFNLPGFTVKYYGINGNELSYNDLPNYIYGGIRFLPERYPWRKGQSSRAYIELPSNISKVEFGK